VASPVVVAQVTNLVASCAAKISRWLQALLASLRRLMAMVRRLGELITDLKRILGRLRGGTEGAEGAREAVTRDTHFFHPDADPLRVHGNAFETHPAEVEAMIKEAKELGVEINWRSDGGLAYGPAPSAGRPGVLVIDRDASYGAWLHEFNHMRDDAAAGWPGCGAGSRIRPSRSPTSSAPTKPRSGTPSRSGTPRRRRGCGNCCRMRSEGSWGSSDEPVTSGTTRAAHRRDERG